MHTDGLGTAARSGFCPESPRRVGLTNDYPADFHRHSVGADCDIRGRRRHVIRKDKLLGNAFFSLRPKCCDHPVTIESQPERVGWPGQPTGLPRSGRTVHRVGGEEAGTAGRLAANNGVPESSASSLLHLSGDTESHPDTPLSGQKGLPTCQPTDSKQPSTIDKPTPIGYKGPDSERETSPTSPLTGSQTRSSLEL
jgi:hypothetical protein